jgi:hypothetical protein
VATAQHAPEIELSVPPGRLEAAASGAGMGAILMLAAGLQSGYWATAMVGIGLSPLAAAIGAVVGAVKAEPVENAKDLQKTIRGALDEADLRAMVRDAVLQAAAGRTAHPLTPVPGAGPAAPEERPTYRDLGRADIDTVLELMVTSIRLMPEARQRSRDDSPFELQSNPGLTLTVTARTRLVGVADGVVLDSRTLTASSAGGSRTFAAWAQDDAVAVREGLSQAAQSLAETIVGNVLGISPPHVETTIDPSEGDIHDDE